IAVFHALLLGGQLVGGFFALEATAHVGLALVAGLAGCRLVAFGHALLLWRQLLAGRGLGPGGAGTKQGHKSTSSKLAHAGNHGFLPGAARFVQPSAATLCAGARRPASNDLPNRCAPQVPGRSIAAQVATNVYGL